MTLSEYLKKHQLTQKAFGERLHVSQGLVGFWVKGEITAERAIQVERATSGEVPREHSRPDIEWEVVRPIGCRPHSEPAASLG